MSDISELMSRDPLKLTNEDTDAIIEYMRKQRHLFKNNLGNKPAKRAAPKLTEKQEKLAKLDLGNELKL